MEQFSRLAAAYQLVTQQVYSTNTVNSDASLMDAHIVNAIQVKIVICIEQVLPLASHDQQRVVWLVNAAYRTFGRETLKLHTLTLSSCLVQSNGKQHTQDTKHLPKICCSCFLSTFP
jgi:hypothetical protein